MAREPHRRFVAASLLLGFGFAGLADGIVLHHILQWHNLITHVETNQTLKGLQRNLFWDGVFHMAAVVLTVTGIVLLWGHREPHRAEREPLSRLAGFALIGWGAFHVVDHLAFHLILDLHSIREGAGDPSLYNWAFFAIGIALGAVGWLILRSSPASATSSDASSPGD